MSKRKDHFLSRSALSRSKPTKSNAKGQRGLSLESMQAQKEARILKCRLFSLARCFAERLTASCLTTVMCNHLNISKKC